MKPKSCRTLPPLSTFLLAIVSAIAAGPVTAEVPGITLPDSGYTATLLDTDEKEFFTSQTTDFAGRLFVGCREALYVYEPKKDGGFSPRQELYRFPKDSWLYDLEVYGNDILVLCNTALYRIPDAVSERGELTPKKLLWGNPQGHFHQGLHGMEFGPTGDLFISMGDPQPHLHWDRARPDHLWHWTFYVGPENKPFHYTGVGAVMRYRLNDHSLSVHASGLRNPCGISFDPAWNLFANENDQEGASASPGRLVYAPAHSWHGWVRGWSAQQQPKRRDLLPVVNLELDVPVGQCWHEGSVLVANWGNRTVSRHQTTADGGGFSSPSDPFLIGDGLRRPVSITPLNDGRLVAAVCYMEGNEGSPVRKTDLLLLSRGAASAHQNFTPSEPGDLADLLAKPWVLRYKAHQEILRRGGPELQDATARFLISNTSQKEYSSLIFLAAADGERPALERIQALAEAGDAHSELAIRVMAEFASTFAPLDVEAILKQRPNARVRRALVTYLHAISTANLSAPTLSEAVCQLAADSDPYVRQSAAQLLARRASPEQLAELAASPSETLREAAVNAAGFHIWETIEATTNFPEQRAAARAKQLVFEQADGPVSLSKLGKPVLIFMAAEWWRDAANRNAVSAHYSILANALNDPSPTVQIPAAVQLFFLKNTDVDERVLAILERERIDLSSKPKASQNTAAEKRALRAIKSATIAQDENIPAAFAGVDWNAAHRAGKAESGKTLFTTRGCIACHLAPDDGRGGSIGPSLHGVQTRFTPAYLAESILLPNRFVSPNFHPTTLTMKDGTVHTGFIEQDGTTVELRMITGLTTKLAGDQIAKRETSHQSMMPAGLVQTPAEMGDLLAFMLGSTGTAGSTEKAAGLAAWQTTGNWNENAAGVFTLTPRPGETDWKRYGDYLWSKQPYQNFEIAFEYKHDKGGNSGLYFNVADRDNAKGSVIEVQIRDSAGVEKLDAHAITGGILPGITPQANATKPAGQWNQMTVRSQGGVVRVTLNGTVVNRVKLDHPKLKAKPKQGFIGFQDHALPFSLRNIRLRKLGNKLGKDAKDAKAVPAAPGGKGAFDPGKPNVYRFEPQQARFARLTLLAGAKAQPCVDEFEIFGPGSEKNLALTGKASASSVLKDNPKHKIAHLNDGKYGNACSWIPAKKTGWAQIELPEPVQVDRVVLSRDREGKTRGRPLVNFDIQLSKDGKEWSTVRRIRVGGLKAAPKKGPIDAPNKKGAGKARENSAAPAPMAAPDSPRVLGDARGSTHPNIVLILADDFGWGDASCNNPATRLKTPAIDRIAREGIRLTNAHTPSAVCTPTRYGLLTGRYPWRSYLKKQVLAYYAPALIPKGRTTIASHLKSQGYRTGGFGKWHLGLDWTPVDGDPANWRSHWNTRDKQVALRVEQGIDHKKPFKNGPGDIGFDTFFGTPSNCNRLPFFIDGHRVLGNPAPGKTGELRDPECVRNKVDDLYVARAVRFMAARSEKPFFVYLPLNAIHGASQVPERFAGKTSMTQREDKILWVNESVRKILGAIDRMNIAQDTLVMFTTDNGPIMSQVARRKGHLATGPYRGLKTNAYDGGTRVPFMARWPGHIPAGATSDQLIGLTDVLATLAAISGAPLPTGQAPDSHNMLPVLLQKPEREQSPRSALVTASYEGFLTLRSGDWKAVFGTHWTGGHFGAAYGGPPPEGTPPDDPESGQLFNIAKDPYETENLWQQRPEVVRDLRQQLAAIQAKDNAEDALMADPSSVP